MRNYSSRKLNQQTNECGNRPLLCTFTIFYKGDNPLDALSSGYCGPHERPWPSQWLWCCRRISAEPNQWGSENPARSSIFLGGDLKQTFQTGNSTCGKIVVSSVCKVDTISCGSHFQSSNPLRDICGFFTVANAAGIQNLKVR
jgi:hypothetical protein